MNEDFTRRNSCRICGHSDFTKILDLGEMPPANAYLKKEDLDKPEEEFPLVVYFCTTCGLLQLLDVVDPKILFKDYRYITSASKPLAEHFVAMAHELANRFVAAPDDLVVEIGGNDGALLAAIQDRCRVLNVDPALSVATLARRKGIETMTEFFTMEVAERVSARYGSAKLVVANNVIAHIDGVREVFEGVGHLIGDAGVFVFEVHWVGNLIHDGGFDQIYHEHLSYFSLTALKYLVESVGLNIFDIELEPIHGQSLRAYVGKGQPIADSVHHFLRQEQSFGLDRVATFLDFSKSVERAKQQLQDLLRAAKRDGACIVGYGAPGKGNTLLNYCRIGIETVDFITDTTPFKQGLYTPGMHIPIYAPDRLAAMMPDYILLLAWNYADAILERERALRDRGAKFIIPVPTPRIV